MDPKMDREEFEMEKKSTNFHKNNPKDAPVSYAEEAGQKVESGKKLRVKTIGDPEFDQAIDSLIHEMVIHS
jgi:hypothetical protein